MAAPSVHLDLPGDVEKATGPHHVEKATGPHHTEKAHRPHHTKKADRPHHTEVAAGSQTQTSPVPSSPSRVGKDDVEMADGGPQHTEKVDTPHHTEKVDRPHHTEKVDRPHHTEKVDRPHHNEVAAGSQTQTSPVPSSPSRVGKDDVEMADGGPQHTEKVDTPHHTEKVDRPHHTEKVDTPHHTEKVDRPHHNEVAAGSQTQTSPVPSSPSRVGKVLMFYRKMEDFEINNTSVAESYNNNDTDNDYEESDSTILKLIFIENVVMCIIISVGLLLTLVAIYGLYSQVRNGHVAPIYVINLLISDIIQICSLIVYVAEPENYFIEGISDFTYNVGLMASVCFMVCVALERYLVVAWPLWYRFRRNIKTSVVVSVM
ncbi:hypothetical protein INR49_007605, partial [Caranx melampygus]